VVAFKHRGVPYELGQHLVEAKTHSIKRERRSACRHCRSIPSEAKGIEECHVTAPSIIEHGLVVSRHSDNVNHITRCLIIARSVWRQSISIAEIGCPKFRAVNTPIGNVNAALTGAYPRHQVPQVRLPLPDRGPVPLWPALRNARHARQLAAGPRSRTETAGAKNQDCIGSSLIVRSLSSGPLHEKV
jgi:hypothetical protein